MGVLSLKVKSRSRAATLLRSVFESIAATEVYITAALLESPRSKTASLLLEKCDQVSLELTSSGTWVRRTPTNIPIGIIYQPNCLSEQ
jgi:hypothetical protein